MRKPLTILLAGITIIAFAFGACQSSSKSASGSKMLKFNLEQGKGYDYEMNWDMETRAAGQDMSVSMTGLYDMVVTASEGGVRDISTSFQKISMFMKMMGMEMEFGSDTPIKGDTAKNNPLAMMNKMLRSLTGKKFTIRVNEEGKVLEVVGFNNIVESMIDSMGLDESARAQARASMNDQFSEQSIKDNFAQVLNIFPNKEVKVGDSWTREYSTGGKMAAKHITTYTVKDIEGDQVTLNAESKIKTAEGGEEINGTQTGKILVDARTGLTINANFEQDFEVQTQGMRIDVRGKGKIRGTAK